MVGELPTVIIIGAMKCATSSLHYYMGLHPGIWMSRRKELNYFSDEATFARGESWYRSWFRTDLPVRGEASPGYSAWPHIPDVPERMRSVVPDAKLIYMIRDPVERLLSHYRHNIAEMKDDRPLESAVLEPDNVYVARSLYGMQLERYLEHWSLDRILIVRRESLLVDRDRELSRVFRFIGADPSYRDIRFRWRRHSSALKRRKTAAGQRLASTRLMQAVTRLPRRMRWPIEDAVFFPFSRPVPVPVADPALRRELRSVFVPDLRLLGRLTGERFDEWIGEPRSR